MRYAKFIVAALTAGLIALQTAITDDRITTSEWVTIALAVLGAIGVVIVPNKTDAEQPGGRYTTRG
jgi:hypothetical protein